MKITKDGFIKITIPNAEANAADLGKYGVVTNSKTFNNKDKKYAALGEYVFGKVFRSAKYVGNNSYDYDYILDSKKIDIKTKRRTVYPQLYYTASVPKYQVEMQKNTHYCFVSIKKTQRGYVCHICGKIEKSGFVKKAHLVKEGEVNGSNQILFTEDSFVLTYGDLQRWI
jgi:hypothetical protein